MTAKATLYTLLKALVGAETLVFADQNAPRPALPYWTLRLGSVRRLGHEHYTQGVDVNLDQTVSGVREVTAQVQRYGTGAAQKVEDLRDSLFLPSVSGAWQLANVALYNTGDVQDVPFKLDNAQLEPRASLDLFVRFGTDIKDNVGAIETVSIQSEYVTNQGQSLDVTNPDLAETVIVVL